MKNKKIVSLFVAFTLFCTSINFSFAETDTEDSVVEITNESKEENSPEGSVKDESDIVEESGDSSEEEVMLEEEGDLEEFYREANPFLFEEPKLERIQGTNNYETAAKIADKQSYNSVILVNLDNNIADGLSASGLSGATNSPILLTQKDTVPDVTMQRISTKASKVYIIGGINSVSSAVESKLKSAGKTVIRIQGSDRVDTSIKVADEIKKHVNSQYVFLVNGFSGEADAISISPVSSMYKSPIILTDGNKTNYSSSSKECYVIGGSNNMSDAIVSNNNATRISGSDRFETNEDVINHFLDTDSYLKLMEEESLSFHVVDGYNLQSGLLASTITKDAMFSLASTGNDKGYMFVANKIVVFGQLNESIIKDCLNPYPVYGEMFGMWISDLNENKELCVDPDYIMTFIDGNPESTNIENSKFKIKKINSSEKSVIIEELGRIDNKRYTRLTKLSDVKLKIDTSSDMSAWKNTEYYTSVFSEEGQSAMFNTTSEFKAAQKKRIVRICKVKTMGTAIDVTVSLMIGGAGIGALQMYIKKKGKQAARRIFTKTIGSRIKAKGAAPLAFVVGFAADRLIGLATASVGNETAKFWDNRDPRPGNGYIEITK